MANQLYERKKVLAVKTETTRGTAISTAAADCAHNFFDSLIRPDVPLTRREQQGSADDLAGVPGARMGRLTMRAHLAGSGGSGSIPLWATTLLPACGWKNTAGTFARSLAQADQTTITARLYRDGRIQPLHGAAGNFNIVVRNGAAHDINFDFVGKYGTEVDGATPTPITFPTVIPPRGTATATVNGAAIRYREMTLASGGAVKLLEDVVNDADATGYAFSCIPTFDTTISFDPEARIISGNTNFAALYTASTEFAFETAIGSVANNRITLAASRLQVIEHPDFGTRDGVMTRTIRCRANDGFTIQFT